MSSEWPLLKLKDVGVSLIDCDHKTPKAQEVGFPYIGIPQIRDGRILLEGARLISEEDFHQWRRKSKPMPNDVVLSRRCNPGETAFVPENLEIALGQNLVLLRSDARLLYPPFLRWVVQGPHWWDQVRKFINVGAIFDSLKCADIPQFEVRVPPLKVQEKIAGILGSLDDKIELNRQTNQTLEQIAQALFKSWFVDFEPTRAKIAAKEAGASPEEIERAAMCAISGKTPDQLDHLPPETQQNLKTTAALFPDALVDSELGEIPAGWVVGAVENYIDILNGHAFKSNDYAESGTFVLRTKNFNNGVVERLNDDVFLPNEFRQTHKQYLCEPFDYHLVMVGAGIGNTGLIYPHLLPALRNQNMWCFRARSVSYSKQFFVKFVLDHIIKSSIGLASGSAREFFRKGDFGKQKICVGHKSIQETFHTLVKPLMHEQSTLDAQNQKLTLIRDTLLPRLLSNELAITELIEESV